MENYQTFKTKYSQGILTVTFDYPPVNIYGIPMINDLNKLCDVLEKDKETKVIIFESNNKDIFIAHADIDMLKDLSTTPIQKKDIVLSPLQAVNDRISKLPQATISKVEGMARGGGHEFVLATDLRFASIQKAVFMQMEVGMGILPCGGGSSRMARNAGICNALEIILSARDFDAKEAEKFGTINKALDENEISSYVQDLANRIAKFPLDSIKACKQMVRKSLDMPLEQALLEENYLLYQCTSKTDAIQRFKNASDTNFQNSLENQKNFESLLMTMQD